ncbi:hypothetical protein O3M35_001083 [Rhynocoris fuscipes]|uniref:CHK kinase-like domain-containing protein n=1 Tax=Rhynocoris fuscipes TaxID=488301 RepID=A0AAW1DSV5_9HEMI
MSSSLTEISQDDSAWLETLLQKFFHDNSISRVVKLTKEDVGVKGDNYNSEIVRVTVEMILNSGRKSKKTLIMKRALGVSIPMPVFKLEATIYDKVVSELNALMNEFQDPNDSVLCEMFGYEPNTTLVLEDLKAKNFKVADRRKQMDMNHSLLVLNSLGRLHGMSHVLLKRGTIGANDLGADLVSPHNAYAPRILIGGFHQMGLVMEEFWPPEWKEAGQKFVKFSKVVMEKINDIMINYPKDTFLVMNHGDCWTCNMMFKYCPYDETIPIAVKFFDLPFSSINSYIIDVVHFVYMCTRHELRRQNLDILYRAYQKSLASTLEFYGMPGIAPTLEQVYAEAERVKILEMFFAGILVAVTTGDIPGFRIEKAFIPCEAKEVFYADVFKPEEFRKKIELDLKRWLKDGYLDC